MSQHKQVIPVSSSKQSLVKSDSPVHSEAVFLRQYLQKIAVFPMLEKDEEFILAKNWVQYQDRKAFEAIVNSHLRLVAKIAIVYRHYGLPLSEIIGEGNVGLLQAMEKFDPDKGFRFATYAMWWIKAYIQEYILKNWSLVKIANNHDQKRLFFKLNQTKKQLLGGNHQGLLTNDQAKQVATHLAISQDEVITMDHRLNQRDVSLNAVMGDSDTDSSEWQDFMKSDEESVDEKIILAEDKAIQLDTLKSAVSLLNEREREIFVLRKLSNQPLTLEELSVRYGLSKERVRQIELNAFKKVKQYLLEHVK